MEGGRDGEKEGGITCDWMEERMAVYGVDR